MAATAADNIIRFPDGARGSVADYDRAQVLSASRDTMAQRLREALRVLLTRLQEELLAQGDIADEREERSFYYGGRELLATSALRLEGIFAAQWLGLFDQVIRGAVATKRPGGEHADDLALVDFGEMDEDIAVKAITATLGDACEEGLYAANRRLTYLAGLADDVLHIEEIVAHSLRAAFSDAGFPTPLRAELLRKTQAHAATVFDPAIHDLNAFLVGRGIVPNLRRTFAQTPVAKTQRDGTGKDGAVADSTDVFALLQRLVAAQPMPLAGATAGANQALPPFLGGADTSVLAAGAAATMAIAMEKVMASLDVLQRTPLPQPTIAGPISANVLREFRASDTGQNLGYLDAVTVDIVATLFDFIFDDPAIGDPIKALVARLQIPVLKVAMLDKGFFSSKAHPARRLLDCISRAAVRCGPQVDHQDPLYATIAAIVDRLQTEFAQDTQLFDVLNVELENFLEQQEQQADARAAQAAPLVEAQEHKELAAMAAEQSLAGWLAMSLPAVITDLLNVEWRALLVRSYLANDRESWSEAINTVSELVASVQPHTEIGGRKLLAAHLPALVNKIHDYLNSLAVPEDRRLALIDALFSLHAAVLRGTTPVLTTVWPAAPTAGQPAVAEMTSEHFETGDTQLDSISLAEGAAPAFVESGDEARESVGALQRGDWVEFIESGTALRYRLSWISPQRGILLFTNPHSPRALSIAPAALVLRVERGDARVVPVEPIFDRAVSRALETLKVV